MTNSNKHVYSFSTLHEINFVVVLNIYGGCGETYYLFMNDVVVFLVNVISVNILNMRKYANSVCYVLFVRLPRFSFFIETWKISNNNKILQIIHNLTY